MTGQDRAFIQQMKTEITAEQSRGVRDQKSHHPELK